MVLKPKLEQMVGLIIAPCLFSVPPPPLQQPLELCRRLPRNRLQLVVAESAAGLVASQEMHIPPP